MALGGAPWQIAVFALLAAALGVVGFTKGQTRASAGRLFIWATVAFVLVKFGYVRHNDIRHAHAMAALAVAGAFMLASTAGSGWGPVRTLAGSAVLLGAVGFAYQALPRVDTISAIPGTMQSRLVHRLEGLRSLADRDYWARIATQRAGAEGHAVRRSYVAQYGYRGLVLLEPVKNALHPPFGQRPGEYPALGVGSDIIEPLVGSHRDIGQQFN